MNNNKTEYKSLLDKLKLRINENQIKIYLTPSILWETGKDIKADRKKELICFITDYTSANTIIPFFKIFPLEIKNYIYIKMNKPTINLDQIIFKEGFPYLFGCKGEIIPIKETSDSDEKLKEVTDFMNGKESIIKMVSNEKICDIFRKYPDPFGVYDTLTDTRQKIINDPLIKNQPKIRKLEVLIANYFGSVIGPFIIEKQIELKLPKEFLLNENSTKEDFYKLIENLPCLNTYFHLLLKKGSDISKELKINDSFDIMSYAIVVPYCDIVVAENQFYSYIKDKKLDDLYKTKILRWSDINQLENLL